MSSIMKELPLVSIEFDVIDILKYVEFINLPEYEVLLDQFYPCSLVYTAQAKA